jgi:hypothetical protein
MFPEYSVKWAYYYFNHRFEFEMNYGNSSAIKNFNARSTIQELSLLGKHRYLLKETQFIGKPVYFYLGLYWNLYIHIIKRI